MLIHIDQQLQQLLFALAYKMTGEISISQDISQEAISKYLNPNIKHASIQNHRSYLIKTTIHTAIDYLNKIRSLTYRVNYLVANKIRSLICSNLGSPKEIRLKYLK